MYRIIGKGDKRPSVLRTWVINNATIRRPAASFGHICDATSLHAGVFPIINGAAHRVSMTFHHGAGRDASASRRK